MTRHPRRPGPPGPEADGTLATLLDTYQQHVLLLAAARVDPRREPARRVGERALAALAIAHAVVADLAEERWPIVRDALAAGVPRDRVRDATGGLEPDELAAGLTAWADRRLAAGLLSAIEHGRVLALVGARLTALDRTA
jgi:hypothetical protein